MNNILKITAIRSITFHLLMLNGLSRLGSVFLSFKNDIETTKYPSKIPIPQAFTNQSNNVCPSNGATAPRIPKNNIALTGVLYLG